MITKWSNKSSLLPLHAPLCPLLQTLGLKSEARDSFLDFVETTVFTAVSADAASVEGATDPATAYAKSLSSVFNSAYLIIQQYLPMVIQVWKIHWVMCISFVGCTKSASKSLAWCSSAT